MNKKTAKIVENLTKEDALYAMGASYKAIESGLIGQIEYDDYRYDIDDLDSLLEEFEDEYYFVEKHRHKSSFYIKKYEDPDDVKDLIEQYDDINPNEYEFLDGDLKQQINAKIEEIEEDLKDEEERLEGWKKSCGELEESDFNDLNFLKEEKEMYENIKKNLNYDLDYALIDTKVGEVTQLDTKGATFAECLNLINGDYEHYFESFDDLSKHCKEEILRKKEFDFIIKK